VYPIKKHVLSIARMRSDQSHGYVLLRHKRGEIWAFRRSKRKDVIALLRRKAIPFLAVEG
jgi:hypothetical protein